MVPLVLALLFSGVECLRDDQCTLRTRCSCECCPLPEPMTKDSAEHERKRCMVVGSCGDLKEPCPKVCPADQPSVAVCREGRCVKVPKAKASDAGR